MTIKLYKKDDIDNSYKIRGQVSTFALGSWVCSHNSHVEISGDERNGKEKEGMAA
jgi:hypothetical protein